MAVIELHHVDKIYHLGKRSSSLREAIAQGTVRLVRRQRGEQTPPLHALDNVSFEVKAGEALGIIGHNGAGKSTILKLLSRVAFPTNGTIHTNGRLAALIELGAGFHPELSGRENIYLNGSILGLKRREITAQFDQIVEFAGLEAFIDTPVKRYSSGMYVRLAFAVAAHVRSDILLVDEVLSVGDVAFQQKCMTKMQELRDQGVTIVLVTHNLWTVESFCDRAILLNHGKIQAEGSPAAVVQAYRQNERDELVATTQAEATTSAPDTPAAANKDETVITRVEILDKDGQPKADFESWDSITVRVHYRTPKPIQSPYLVIRISRSDGLVCCRATNSREPDFSARQLAGEGVFEVLVGPLPLLPDTYNLDAHIADSQQPILHASSSKQTFRINGDLGEPGESGVFWVDAYWKSPEVSPTYSERPE
ncbi:MAG: ABC transporter ATP-binding protein [Anaerolineaceae bacterium]|nr:ABC transporter ATP-binding protein [Anaerolineaceae bacterium]